mgnify:CR=1 FL=1
MLDNALCEHDVVVLKKIFFSDNCIVVRRLFVVPWCAYVYYAMDMFTEDVTAPFWHIGNVASTFLEKNWNTFVQFAIGAFTVWLCGFARDAIGRALLTVRSWFITVYVFSEKDWNNDYGIAETRFMYRIGSVANKSLSLGKNTEIEVKSTTSGTEELSAWILVYGFLPMFAKYTHEKENWGKRGKLCIYCPSLKICRNLLKSDLKTHGKVVEDEVCILNASGLYAGDLVDTDPILPTSATERLYPFLGTVFGRTVQTNEEDDYGRTTWGLLLYGPPGTGKTSLAKHIARRSNANLIVVKPKDILEDSTGQTLCTRFEQWRWKKSRYVMLLDEVDMMLAGERCNEVLAELHLLLDTQFKKKPLLVVLTTNHMDMLPDALRRCGRIDMKLEMAGLGENELQEFVKRMSPSSLADETKMKSFWSLVRPYLPIPATDALKLLECTTEAEELEALSDLCKRHVNYLLNLARARKKFEENFLSFSTMFKNEEEKKMLLGDGLICKMASSPFVRSMVERAMANVNLQEENKPSPS